MSDNNQMKNNNNQIKINDQLKPNIYIPTPFPDKIDKNTFKQNQTSSIAQYKRELNDLESKYSSLLKLNEKNQKKFKEQIEESKALKSSNESLLKELTILQKTNEKIIADKFSLDSLLEENKAYTRRLETKLINGAKNQFLIEINSKLKDDLNQSNQKHDTLKEEKDNLIKEINKRDHEISIYQKAIELKSNEFKKAKVDISPNALYHLGISKEEIDSLKQQNNDLNNKTNQLTDLLNKDKETIEELLFSVKHLTSIVANKEAEIEKIVKERDYYKNDHATIKSERDFLRNIVETKSKEEKEIEEDIKDEATHYLNTITQLEYQLKQNESSSSEYKIQIALLNNNINTLTTKYNTIENSFKSQLEALEKYKAENDSHKRSIKELNEEINQLRPVNNQYSQLVNELNEKTHLIEKENIELISKNNNLVLSYEKRECDLIKQNQVIAYNEVRLKEQIDKLNNEIEILRDEREQYKSIMSDIESKSKTLQLERTEIEENLNKKTLQIEKLKENNNYLHKTLSNNSHNNSHSRSQSNNKTEEEKNSIINDESIISKKKIEKGSRNLLDEIRKLKSNMREVIYNQSKTQTHSDN